MFDMMVSKGDCSVVDKQAFFRKIPAVDRLLEVPSLVEAATAYPRSLILKGIHEVLDEIRQGIVRDEFGDPSEFSTEQVSEKVLKKIVLLAQSSLRAVINATGVVVHTNLGRSILAERVLQRFKPLSGGYSNLEYNLDQGKRGSSRSNRWRVATVARLVGDREPWI